jgi:hypothetical protein
VASPTDHLRLVLAAYPIVRVSRQQGGALPPPRPLHRAPVRACCVMASAGARAAQRAGAASNTNPYPNPKPNASPNPYPNPDPTPTLILTLTLTLTVALTLQPYLVL